MTAQHITSRIYHQKLARTVHNTVSNVAQTLTVLSAKLVKYYLIRNVLLLAQKDIPTLIKFALPAQQMIALSVTPIKLVLSASLPTLYKEINVYKIAMLNSGTIKDSVNHADLTATNALTVTPVLPVQQN
jgi:hypothetical protein